MNTEAQVLVCDAYKWSFLISFAKSVSISAGRGFVHIELLESVKGPFEAIFIYNISFLLDNKAPTNYMPVGIEIIFKLWMYT